MVRNASSVLLSLIMTHAFLVSWLGRSSRPSSKGRLLVARAFSTRTTTTRTSRRTGAVATNEDRNYGFLSTALPGTIPRQHALLSSSLSSSTTATRRWMSTITEEQDLDEALDQILGDAAAKKAPKPTNGSVQHIGAPMPKTLVEQVRCFLTVASFEL